MKIAVGIATFGRAETLKQVLDVIKMQSRKADAIMVCPVSDTDVEGTIFDGERLIRVASEQGSSAQRNAIMKTLESYDLVVFFDDDFVPHVDFLKEMEIEFQEHPETVIATGTVLADGAKTKGILFAQANEILTHHQTPTEKKRDLFFSAYGCNMAVRVSTVLQNNIWFDEQLPLYGWLEDLDFTCRIVSYGESIKTNLATGVHLAVKRGRTSGLRYGYSQVANPLYIASKRTGFTYIMAVNMLGRNIAANMIKSFFPEPYIDRRGRLKGNLIAMKDWIVGKLDPRKIIKL